jgi:hypothetical protein
MQMFGNKLHYTTVGTRLRRGVHRGELLCVCWYSGVYNVKNARGYGKEHQEKVKEMSGLCRTAQIKSTNK